MLERVIEAVLPGIATVCELMGIAVVAHSAARAFWRYLRASLGPRGTVDVKFELANGLATALEFKMAAEILKTVLVRSLSELVLPAAVILLRALLSVQIHAEMRGAAAFQTTTGGKEK